MLFEYIYRAAIERFGLSIPLLESVHLRQVVQGRCRVWMFSAEAAFPDLNRAISQGLSIFVTSLLETQRRERRQSRRDVWVFLAKDSLSYRKRTKMKLPRFR